MALVMGRSVRRDFGLLIVIKHVVGVIRNVKIMIVMLMQLGTAKFEKGVIKDLETDVISYAIMVLISFVRMGSAEMFWAERKENVLRGAMMDIGVWIVSRNVETGVS